MRAALAGKRRTNTGAGRLVLRGLLQLQMIRKSSFSRGSRLDAAPSVAVVAPPAPRRSRGRSGCTDCPCLLLFFATLGGLGYVAFLSLQPPSDFRRVLYGLDSQHDLCGVDNRVETTREPRDVTVTFRPSAFRRLWPSRYLTFPRL